MNIETLLWIGAWIVLSEILFIIGLINDWDILVSSLRDSWGNWKFLSFCIMGAFVLIQASIVFGDVTDGIAHYIRLLYECIILLGIWGLILFNKAIVNFINKSEKRKKKKNGKHKK